jgi:hypothetical protein
MDRLFKIHCSQISKIMGSIGLTEIQLGRMKELQDRKDGIGKTLTANMEVELATLVKKHTNPELPSTATTFLKEWYANDREDVYSKYTDKGNYVEGDVIEMMADVLGFGLAEKNMEERSDEYFIGTCDVAYPKVVVDTKAPWNRTTLQSNLECIDDGYEYQGRGYMRLWKVNEFILFYGLVNTPADVNHDNEIIFDDKPVNERWIAYKIKRDVAIEDQIIERVKMCRVWLDSYDLFVKSRIGKVIDL